MFVSIVICTYNREAYLPTCLEHLKNQSANPSDFEVILVDNNSKDSTEDICKSFIEANNQLNVLYVKETQPGLSFARNRGIDESKGDVICFIDDDGYANSDYVSIVKSFAENKNYSEFIAFGGKVKPWYNPGKDPKWISKYIIGVVSGVDLGEEIKPFDKKYPAGCNMIFRKEFFEKYSRFNTDLHTRGDDKFVFDQLRKAGLKTLYIPSLEVDHFIDDYRLEKPFIVRLSKVIGQSEAIRLKDAGFSSKFMKFVEYLFKFGAACVLSIPFGIKLQWSKAQYILLVRWYVIIGYFTRERVY